MLCLISELILYFGIGANLSFNIINFSHFFFLLTFDHGNVGICLRLMLYIFRRGHLLPFLSLCSHFVHCVVANFSLLLCFHFIILPFHYYLIPLASLFLSGFSFGSFFLSGISLSCRDILSHLLVISFCWDFILLLSIITFLSVRLHDCFVKELLSQPNMSYLSIKNCHMSDVSSPQAGFFTADGICCISFSVLSSVIRRVV